MPAASKPIVLFYLGSLAGGGAERAMLELSKNIDRHLYEPVLLVGSCVGDYHDEVDRNILFTPKGSIVSFYSWYWWIYKLPIWLQRRRLGCLASRLVALRRMLATSWISTALRSTSIQYDYCQKDVHKILVGYVDAFSLWQLRQAVISIKPDILVSTMVENGAALALIVKSSLKQWKGRWVAIEQNSTYRRLFDYFPDPKTRESWKHITSICYAAADQVVAVSNGVKDGLESNFGVNAKSISVIYNPVDLNRVQSSVPVSRDRRFILACGRLHPQKQFHHLIEAYFLIADQIDIDLLILGQGELEANLKALVVKLGLARRVIFGGFSEDPWSFMKSAECLVMSSAYEGMPLTIIEAMAAGCPVISYDIDYGPREVIQHGESGILVMPEDIKGLASSMLEVLLDPLLQERLRKGGEVAAMKWSSAGNAVEYSKVFSRLLN